MGNVLKIENLKYKKLLKNITFSIKEKSFNILLGPNGSGKTTIINCIRGLKQYEGKIELFNNDIRQKDSSDFYKEVGFFLDNGVLLEDKLFDELLSILKNLDYEEEKAKKRIFSIAKKFDITEALFKEEKDLLEHEKILISFILSIIHDPKLLIIDNDLETIDEKYKNKMFEYIKSQKKLTTLLIATNSDYFYNADNLLFLRDGEIVLSGNFTDVMSNEKAFIKSGSHLPFSLDLSNKLISYELLDSVELDIEKMVNKIWK